MAADLRGRYSGPAGALKALRRAGFQAPIDVARARIGPDKPTAFASVGDGVAADLQALGLAGAERQIGLSLGICVGRFSLFVGETGLVPIPTSKMTTAFNGQGSQGSR